jgi:hypothetical protein
MAEDQRGLWLIGDMQVGIRLTVRGFDFQLGHNLALPLIASPRRVSALGAVSM